MLGENKEYVRKFDYGTKEENDFYDMFVNIKEYRRVHNYKGWPRRNSPLSKDREMFEVLDKISEQYKNKDSITHKNLADDYKLRAVFDIGYDPTKKRIGKSK